MIDLLDHAIEILRALAITEPSRAQLLLAHLRLLDMNFLQPMTDGTCGDRVGTQVQGDDVVYVMRDDPVLSCLSSALIVGTAEESLRESLFSFLSLSRPTVLSLPLSLSVTRPNRRRGLCRGGKRVSSKQKPE